MKTIQPFFSKIALITFIFLIVIISSSYIAPPAQRYKPNICIYKLDRYGKPDQWTAGCETIDPNGPCKSEYCCSSTAD